jgi:hypothetical protein
MGSIVKNKVGKYTYIYESVSYRDENGKPQTKKTPIGKYDLYHLTNKNFTKLCTNSSKYVIIRQY